MILVDLLMKCFLLTSFSRYISLPHLHSKVLDSSSSPVTMAICSWVSHLPAPGFRFLSFRSALPTSRGC